MVILITLLMLASSFYSQEPDPDSADTVYMPLDSLDAGIDLALRALKMRSGDLTFRGDYLEPDKYRLPIINLYMQEPFRLLKKAQNSLLYESVNVTGFGDIGPDIFGSRNYSNYYEKEIPVE